jgi:hypothetical protein
MKLKSTLRNASALFALILSLNLSWNLSWNSVQAATSDPKAQPSPSASNRVASVYISQDFINEQLTKHSKSELVKEMKIEIDPKLGQIFLRGKIQVPIEELRAVNLDPTLGVFRFQVTIKPKATRQGHLILDFPLDETFFYPDSSKDPEHERVIVPVQLLSLAIASARGYLAALSGDFSGFDRRTEKLTALIKALDRSIAEEKNKDARDDLKTQRDGLKLQLAAVPIERKQLETAAKEVGSILGFTGEKELNLNDELGAHKNALILKIKLSQLTPYLNGTEFGGVRTLFDKKDGNGQNYLAIDLNSDLEVPPVPVSSSGKSARPGMKVAPALVMRLNQSLFESREVLDTEKKDMGNIRNLNFQLKEDGLHVSGQWHTFFVINVPFDTVVDFVSTGADVFEVRLRDVAVAGIDLEFMSKFVLESMKKRLYQALKGICHFKYVGEEKDHSRALQVTVDPKALVPAFPDLHLVGVDVQDGEFLLKIGHI